MSAADRIAQTLLETTAQQAQIANQAAEARARGIAGSGAIWGQSLADLGKTIGNIPAQQAQQQTAQSENQLRAQQVEMGQQEMQIRSAQMAQQQAALNAVPAVKAIRAHSFTDSPDGPILDISKLQAAFDAQPDIPESVVTQELERAGKVNEAIRAQNNAIKNSRADTANELIQQHDPKAPWTQEELLSGLAALHLPDAEISQAVQHAQQAGDLSAPIKAYRLKGDKYNAPPTFKGIGPEDQVLQETGAGAGTVTGTRGGSFFKNEDDALSALADPTRHDAAQAWLDSKRNQDQSKRAPTADDLTRFQANIDAVVPATDKSNARLRAATISRVNNALTVADAQKAIEDAQNQIGQINVARNTVPFKIDVSTLGGQKTQDELEKQYRNDLVTKVESSRSGGLGLEDQKVNQATHLLSLFEQNKDKNGNYQIPRVLQTEVALGLARLVSPTGTVGAQLESEINQRTAKGDLAGLLTYFSGEPVPATPQGIAKMYRDSILRQGTLAEQNRNRYFDAVKAAAPTDLNAERKTAVEKGLGLLTSVTRGDYGQAPPATTHQVGDIVTLKSGVRVKVSKVNPNGTFEGVPVPSGQ